MEHAPWEDDFPVQTECTTKETGKRICFGASDINALLAMRRAVAALPWVPDAVEIDGNHVGVGSFASARILVSA